MPYKLFTARIRFLTTMNPQVQHRLEKIRGASAFGFKAGVISGMGFIAATNLFAHRLPKFAGVRLTPVSLRLIAFGSLSGLMGAMIAGRDFGNFMLETLHRGPKVDPVHHAYQQQMLLASSYQAIQLQNQQAIADHFDQSFEGRKVAIERAKMQRLQSPPARV